MRDWSYPGGRAIYCIGEKPWPTTDLRSDFLDERAAATIDSVLQSLKGIPSLIMEPSKDSV